jgi:replication factor C subunit 3/5
MLLVDKYQLFSKYDITFNHDIYYKLLNYTSKYDYIYNELNFIHLNKTFVDFKNNYKQYYKKINNDKNEKFKNLPNLLFHGHTSSGKKTLIKLLLKEIFGNKVEKLKTETYTITGYSNLDTEINILQSNYHMIIEPNNSGIDKYIIQEIVKEYAKKNVMQIFDKIIPYKIIYINNVDNLSYYAQTSLRCTMEKYHDTCKFILCGYQISKIIEPLRSRCLNIRIPRPNNFELFDYLLYISIINKIKIKPNSINYIINYSNNNFKTCLWYLDFYKNKIYDFNISWKKYMLGIVECIHQTYVYKKLINLNIISEIRNILNNILITNITGSEILTELLNQIITLHPEYPDKLYYQIIEVFSIYEFRLSKGKRLIIHMEALIMKLCHICYIYPLS